MQEELQTHGQLPNRSTGNRRKLLIVVAAVIVLLGAAAGVVALRDSDKKDMGGMDMGGASTQSQPTYSLNLMSGKSYMAAKPTMLHYAIQDQDGKTLKDFDVVHEKKMHLIVVRKDRTNFQHVHPTLDEANGTFMIEPFTFPTDGDYRVYADFTSSNAQKDEMGMKLAVTPSQDVQVGDTSKYTPQALGDDKLASNSNGFETSIFFPPPDDSPGVADTSFYAGKDSNIAISINKNGQPYKNLQTYLGALGHMVVLGPNLEFIHAHPQTVDVNTQGGVIVFAVKFPDAGQYKLYLQTQADNQVNTTDYTLSVKPMPSNSQDSQSMPGMDHSGY